MDTSVLHLFKFHGNLNPSTLVHAWITLRQLVAV
jgi:hypothetical protein